jgi:hypothetical protein
MRSEQHRQRISRMLLKNAGGDAAKRMPE